MHGHQLMQPGPYAASIFKLGTNMAEAGASAAHKRSGAVCWALSHTAQLQSCPTFTALSIVCATGALCGGL